MFPPEESAVILDALDTRAWHGTCAIIAAAAGTAPAATCHGRDAQHRLDYILTSTALRVCVCETDARLLQLPRARTTRAHSSSVVSGGGTQHTALPPPASSAPGAHG